jgi:hypothetical protein
LANGQSPAASTHGQSLLVDTTDDQEAGCAARSIAMFDADRRTSRSASATMRSTGFESVGSALSFMPMPTPSSIGLSTAPPPTTSSKAPATSCSKP